MKRYSKVYLKTFFCEFFDLRNEPAGRKRDMSCTEIQTFRIVCKPYESHYVLIVIERLSDTHYYYAVDPLAQLFLGYGYLSKKLS